MPIKTNNYLIALIILLSIIGFILILSVIRGFDFNPHLLFFVLLAIILPILGIMLIFKQQQFEYNQMIQ